MIEILLFFRSVKEMSLGLRGRFTWVLQIDLEI